MDTLGAVVQAVTAAQRSEQDKFWARLCLRMLTDFELRLSPESYRAVANCLEQEVLPTVPASLQRDLRELIRSLIQDAQYFAWLRELFGAGWKAWRGQGHPQFGDLRATFEQERGITRSPYAYPSAPLPRREHVTRWEGTT